MTNKFFDDSRLGEKIIDIILPKEVIYKEDKGEPVSAQIRHGRLDDDSIYPNRKVINTRYGQLLINPQVKVYFRAFTDENSVITIDIFNTDTHDLFKKFTIKSINNNFLISDMKSLCDEIKILLTEPETEKVKSLIELIRNKENLIFEEVAQ